MPPSLVNCTRSELRGMAAASAVATEPSFLRAWATGMFFLHGFAKCDKANISLEEQKALRFAGKVFLELSPLALCRALKSGVLMEVCCEQQAC